MAGFALFGMITNQLFYLLAVRMTNPGTATVMQCLQIVIIMVYSCVTSRRMPRRREIIGTGLAFLGTLLIATGGDPTTLSIPRWALPWACSALSAGRAFASFPPRSCPNTDR
ncbi:MAG: EamA family transporter [Collinsella sp.]